MTGPIAFSLNGRPTTLPLDTSPSMSLLDWLRGPARLTGTKEGCAEGDCGACTVVQEEADGGRTPLNACLTLLGQVQGRAIRTVEGLRGPDGGPHPVQTTLAEADGTQCGFCTPGIVMALWAQAREGGDPHEALAGNLCRCTGYRPILDAASHLTDDAVLPPEPPPAERVIVTPTQKFFLPTTVGEALSLHAAHPGAWILAGGTDLNLRVSEHRERPPVIISLRDVEAMHAFESTPEALTIGAALPYHRLLRHLRAEPGFGPFAELLSRLGSRQIRGSGTLGGNLGTASPIGDTLPVLLALNARLTIAAGATDSRSLPIDDFFLGYRQTALIGQELITTITLPRPQPGQFFAAQKLSKRYDQDIATVALASLITVEAGTVTAARLALGGVAATPIRAKEAEEALIGAAWSGESIERAATILSARIAPLSDWRATADYRRLAAGNLLRRAFLTATRPDLALEVMALPAPHAPRFITEAPA
ncbi:FAD binding domain-containing protein [Acetobacteraceae bacterium H6797]|nr:FAD binding domain-containing protein [Acetobacteraceae bacterium H6797]